MASAHLSLLGAGSIASTGAGLAQTPNLPARATAPTRYHMRLIASQCSDITCTARNDHVHISEASVLRAASGACCQAHAYHLMQAAQ